MGDITHWMARAREGDRDALDQLYQALYPELRRIAHARLAGHVRDVLADTTVLVHECYLRFVGAQRLGPTDRSHFLAYAAQVMRSIIVDMARARQTGRRGGDAPHQALDTTVAEQVADPAAHPEDQILAVHAALLEVARLDTRLHQVVEMRYFGGLQDAEIAQVLGVTERTVRRDWDKARALLAVALQG